MELAARGDDLKALRRIAAAVIHKAETGDTQAAFAIRDTLDGKPVQATEISGRDGEAIEIDTPVLTTADRAKALAALIERIKSEESRNG
jgi:hypothetical protein